MEETFSDNPDCTAGPAGMEKRKRRQRGSAKPAAGRCDIDGSFGRTRNWCNFQFASCERDVPKSCKFSGSVRV
jgi:hypothetical protein